MTKFKDLIRVFKIYFKISKSKVFLGAASIFFYVLGGILANVITPIYFKGIIDSVTISTGDPWYYFSLYILILIALRASFYLGDSAVFRFESYGEKKCQDYVFNNLANRNYNFYADEFSGSLVAKSNRFHSSFTSLFDQFAMILVPGLVVVIGIIVSAFFQNFLLGIIFLIWSSVHLILTFILIANKIQLTQNTAAQQSKVTGFLSDFLTNSITALSFGAAKNEIKNYKIATSDLKKVRDLEWGYLINLFLVLAFSVNLIGGITLGTSIYLFLNGAITAGTIVLISSYTGVLFSTMFQISRGIDRGTKSLADATEMVEILDTPIEITDQPNAKPLTVNQGQITFNNLTFNYTGEGSDEIDNLNLNIKPGESIGLVGHSGAGKSTIVKLLLRFVDPTEGDIQIDNQNIREVTQESLRQSIAYVPQQPLLFHRTLRENIAYGKPNASMDEIIAASKQANAHEFIQSLPKQYDTLVGERGIKLSGGQRQRVAIARAILKDAPILLLDEATSSLDSKSEREIQAAIKNLIEACPEQGRGRKTVIAIAHRLSTIQHLDRIVVLEQGRIIEEGNHTELLEAGGQYQELWSHQQGGFLV